jgi:hypothetical protein
VAVTTGQRQGHRPGSGGGVCLAGNRVICIACHLWGWLVFSVLLSVGVGDGSEKLHLEYA